MEVREAIGDDILARIAEADVLSCVGAGSTVAFRTGEFTIWPLSAGVESCSFAGGAPQP
jgi:hypothetical protein